MSAVSKKDVLASLARELGVFGALLHALVPRASKFAFYTRDCDSAWCSKSEPAVDSDALSFDFPKIRTSDSFQSFAGPSGATVFATPLNNRSGEFQGYLSVEFEAGVAGLPSSEMLYSIIKPGLSVLVDSLSIKQRGALLDSELRRAEKQLGVIFSLDEKVETAPHGQASLAHLVGAAARHLRIGYSVLLMPDKRIRYGVTHPDWNDVDRKMLDRTALQKLLPSVSNRDSAVLLDVSKVPEGLKKKIDGYQIIACPIREGRSRVTGILALFAQKDGNAFSARDLNFANHITRRTERVIELNYDPLTGLMNRSGFESNLREAYAELKGNGDEHALIFFDMDKMQLFNDTFNHRAGDEVLVRFASELQHCLPKRGVSSRLSGDDFAVLLPHSSVEDGVAFANRLREAAHKMSYLKGDKSHQITVSAGVAPLRINDDGYTGAMISPKVACTAAKDHGRDRVEVYDQDNHSIVRRVDDMQIVGQIHSALSTGDFQLVAQPIVALRDNAAAPYYEVLVRMLDSSGRELKPEAFFSAAERYQLMPKLDQWVIAATIKKLAEHAKRVSETQPVFAINLSGQSLQDDSLLDYVVSLMDEHQVRASGICFEITETAAVANMMTAQRFISTMKARGCTFSLDDFGAGLSSFAYLKSLAVDTLKIDGGFVRDITTNKVSEAMVVAITQVAQVMELKTIAEYVEDEAARDKVRAIGVEYAQGYWVGEPQPLDEVLSDLGSDNAAALGVA